MTGAAWRSNSIKASEKNARKRRSSRTASRQSLRKLFSENLESRILLATDVWINEFHYDNNGGDVGEMVEIAGPAGTSLDDMAIVLYNGSSSSPYNTRDIGGNTIPDEGGGFGAIAFSYPANGLQNGSPDGIALVHNNGIAGEEVVQFLSYEGSFEAASGPAAGMTSMEVMDSNNAPISESSGTQIGFSLQADNSTLPVTGNGVWFAAPETPDTLNNGTTIAIAPVDASKAEGSGGGTTPFTFEVTRSGDTSGSTSFNFSVSVGPSADPASADDFSGAVFPSGSDTFAAGENTKTITIDVLADDDQESDEDFFVTITSAASISTDTALGIIQNDDASFPEFVLDDTPISEAEGNLGTTFLQFEVTRQVLTTGAASVDWTVTPAGADPADVNDFVGGVFPSNTLSFLDGQTTAFIEVPVSGDVTPEASETFEVTLSNPSNGGSIVAPGIAMGTILDDDTEVPNVWINEFHYDNSGGDVGEFVEIAGEAGVDLSQLDLVLYNGSNGTSYSTTDLSGTIPDEGAGYGAVSFSFPPNGIQNGGPDGLALVFGSTLVEFISYEGIFTAVGGPADGVESTDIGQEESGGTSIGDSLQRDNSNPAVPGSWFEPRPESPGLLNLAELNFSLQILHASDLEGGVDAVDRAANFAAIVDELEQEASAAGVGSILLSAGDNYIGGPFFSASGDRDLRDELQAAYQTLFGEPNLTNIREGNGRVDISIMNILGFDASAIGNHEFDFGSDAFAGLISSDIRGGATPGLGDVRWLGAQFPYLSANLDFSQDGSLDGLFTSDILPNGAFESDLGDLAGTRDLPKVAPATRIFVNGEWIGVVGATTQLLEQISSPSGTEVIGPNSNDMAELANILQPVIDDVLNGEDDAVGGGDDINKVILVSHLQQISLETELAGLLRGVDVIIAGGSDTLQADGDDVLRPGDVADGPYPQLASDLDGNPLAIVSTDGEYSYVGRLSVDFDASGVIIPASIMDATSGAYATDEAGVLRVTGDTDLATAIANSTKATEVKKLTDAVQSLVTAKDANIVGRTGVYIEGRRAAVRTQETSMGNLTADANLAAAKTVDRDVVVSIKNGGGIRAEIGSVDGLTGELGPTTANPSAGKLAGEVSQLDIENTLRFNNELSLLTLTAAGLKDVLEHGVAATAPGSTPGQFPQVSGLSFSFDPSLAPGARIQNMAITDELGNVTQEVVRDGVVVGDPNREIRIVTLNFLAGGGDGYPLPALGSDRVDIPDIPLPGGLATFAGPGTEQDALAEYLLRNFDQVPFFTNETPANQDRRIQNLGERPDSVFSEVATEALPIHHLSTLGLDAAEISAFDPTSDKLFVTHSDSGLQVVDFSDPLAPVFDVLLDPATAGAGVGSGVTSVAVGSGPTAGIVAVGVPNPTVTDNGHVVFFEAATNSVLGFVEVGPLPDMVVFTPDGASLLVANEGQSADDDNNPTVNPNPAGSISIIDVNPANVSGSSVSRAGFEAFDADPSALTDIGVRIHPGIAPSIDLEPEFIAVADDGLTAYATLQENNAVAVIDIASSTVVEILPLGRKDHTLPQNAMDPSNRDGVDGLFRNLPVQGIYMPDAIATYSFMGDTYFVTANEGDARDDDPRVGDITLAADAIPFASDLAPEEVLGRLKLSEIDGNLDGDADFEEVHSFGSRSFSIWTSDGQQVFDSGNFMERFTALSGSFQDNRSDDKGPEPEGVTVASIGGTTYAFVGLERTDDVMVFDVTNPVNPQFISNINMPGDESPEGLTVIPASESPLEYDLLVVSNESTQTVSTYGLAPQVRVQVVQNSIEEGQNLSIGLLTREGDLTDSLTVSLSNAPAELTVPPTVTIPAGSPFVEFVVTGTQDFVADGDQLVIIDAMATGYVGSSAAITVLDVDTGGVAPQVEQVILNNGAGTRSALTTVMVFFDGSVNLGASPFLLENLDTGEFVTPTVTQVNGNRVDLTFDGGDSVRARSIQPDSLADGNYQLTVVANQVFSESDSTEMAADFVFGDEFADNFYSLYGDADSDGDVDVFDYLALRRAERAYRQDLDFEGDGVINMSDIFAFLPSLRERKTRTIF